MKKELLYQNWILSDEESTDKQFIFHPETFNFPLRRGGRKAIELSSDNSFVQRNAGADDRYNYAGGSWKLDKTDTIIFDHTIFTGDDKLKIISLDKDKLIVKKI